MKEEWERESNAHKDLNGLDTHLIKAIAAFRYRGDFCLLLEWADGGSLQSLLKEELRPLLTKEAILELLDQLVGLANAMHVMHNKEFLHSSGGSSPVQVVRILSEQTYLRAFARKQAMIDL